MQSQDRQSSAREQQVAQRRGDGQGGGAGASDSDEEHQQSRPNSGISGTLPKVNLSQLVANHEAMEANGTIADTSKVLKDILGVVINMYAKGEDYDKVKKVTEENSFRISQLEAKIGRPEEVSLPLGLAVRHLPLPNEGMTELDNVRMAFREINAAGVEVKHHIMKAVRVGFKAESERGANNGNLGTVKVEMRDEESRAAIMKTKHQLKNHPQLVMRNLVIQNLKSREEMKNENFNYGILKMVTNGNNFYIGGNGHIRRRDQTNPSAAAVQPPFSVPPPAYGQQAPRVPQGQNQAPYNQPQVSFPHQNPYQHVQPQHLHHNQPPLPLRQGHRQQASLLDIDNIFTFDPIQSTNPYQAPGNAVPPPPPQGNQHRAQPDGARGQQVLPSPGQAEGYTGPAPGNPDGQ